MGQGDKIKLLLNERYCGWIQNALNSKKINGRLLAKKLGITAGNSYFRKFLTGEQNYLGITGLISILDKCGYTIKIVIVKKTDIPNLTKIDELNNHGFSDAKEQLIDIASEFVRPEKVVKEKKVIKNTNLVIDALHGMFDDNIENDDLDDYDIEIGDDLDDLE